MATNELTVIKKAKDLMKHTYVLTSNCNRYPKKFRHSLVDRIQTKSMDILSKLREANRINNVTDKELRCEAISSAIKLCDDLQDYIELSIELNLLSGNTPQYWSKMVSDVKFMSIAWRTKEKSCN